MYKHKLIGRAFLFGIALHVLVIGITPTAVSAGNETEILNITCLLYTSDAADE